MSTVAEILRDMVIYSEGSCHDINHFMKVWGYARTIGQLEKLDDATQRVLEISAIVHDIACPSLRARFGHADGKLQELEGPPLAEAFLKKHGLTEQELSRVLYLVGHHHTLTGVDGPDYRVLLEADYLVNADESHYSRDNIQNAYEKMFTTVAGKMLLRSIYGVQD